MADKKGKGSGKKDACYHKVKSRYSVWPSAYASGALVKCRKVGAANWGNKSESFDMSKIDPKKHKDAQKKQKMRNLAIGNENPNEKKVAEKKAGGPKMMGEGKYSDSETYVKGTAPVRATYGGKTESFPKETYKKKSKKVEVSEGDKYDNVGKQAARMSLLNNPSPRSTPEQTAEKKARLEKKRGMKLDDHPQFKKEEVDKRRAPAELVARLSAKREGHMAQDGPNKAAYDAKQRLLKKTKAKMNKESVQDDMRISQEYNRMSPEEKKAVHKKATAGIPKSTKKKSAPNPDDATIAKNVDGTPRRGAGGGIKAD